MTLPGKMLTDSVARLGQSITASKKVSDELRAGTLPESVTPIPVGEVGNEPSDRSEQTSA